MRYENGYIILAISDNKEIHKIVNKSFINNDLSQSYYVINSDISGKIFDIIEDKKPHIILLDLNNKDKGMTLLDDIKEFDISIDIPIVIIANKNKDVEKAIMYGAADFLKTPFDKLELTVRVKSILSMFKLIEGITEQANDLEEQSTKLSKQKYELEQQRDELEEQKKNLEREKSITDNLLQNILPYEIAEQLKNKGEVKAKKYRMVSVLFTDFKDFTKISSDLEPEEIIKELSVYFRKFDDITGEHFIEKIKTIGDAYMAVGGLPLRNKSNPIDVVLAAIEIQKFMKQYNTARKAKGLTVWALRVGIHTGKVVAGVIGSKKFAYDIWGDAVNTASRLETASEPGKINISAVTYEYIKDYFDCTYRGKIYAKNKGEIDMYFVDSIKKEYQDKEDPTLPNQKFHSILTEF